MKTYTGEQGYVYQYYFVGKRPSLAVTTDAPATEYIFDVTSDRKTIFAVSVFVAKDATQDWTLRHGRALTEAEEYAAAKMRLFRGFDEIADMIGQGRRLQLDAPTLDELLANLGVD